MPAVGRLTRPCRISPLLKERLRRSVADELGEALVERSGAFDVERVVGDFMKHRRCELHRIRRQRGGQQRVVEPSQGGKGAGRPKVCIEAPRGKAGFLPARGLGIEESLIGNPSHHRILPGVRADAVPGCGLKDQQQGVSTHIGVGGVGLFRFQPQPGRIVSGVQHQPQRTPHFRIDLTVSRHSPDGLPGLENPGLLESRPCQITHIVAGQVGGAISGEQSSHHHEEDHALQRIRTSAIRGTIVVGNAAPAVPVTLRSTSPAFGGWTTRTW